MPDKPNALHSLGVELDGSSLQAVQLTLRRGKPSLETTFSATIQTQPLSSQESVKPLYIENGEDLALLQKAAHKSLVITPMNTGEVLVRSLEVKLKKEKDIDAVLSFQSEPILPYPVDMAVLDRIRMGDSLDGTFLTLLAVRKDHLSTHIEQWKTLEIEPEAVSCIPAALAAFAAYFAPAESPRFLVHLGWGSSSCILNKDNKLAAAQACSCGISVLRKGYMTDVELSKNGVPKPFEELDFSNLDAAAYPSLTAALELLRREVTRTLYALGKQSKGKEVPDFLITGIGASLKGLTVILSQAFGKPLVELSTNPSISLSVHELQRLAVPIGLALSGLPKTADPINFRQVEFVYPYPWKRIWKPLSLYLGLCVALAIAFYYLGQAWLSYKEDALKSEFIELLASMKKPYKEFETEYELKFPGSSLGDSKSILPPHLLTQDEITKRLRVLEKELEGSPDTFPLFPNVPRVTDVLAWLANHPNVVLIDPVTQVRTPLLQIQNFSYTLVKRPEQTKKQEKYQVKVEMELSTSTPKLAREFHDALIAPNDMVDPKGEVKWNANRGLYRTSFFLKDKTVYPSSSK
jgi:type IV pilus assembly protein PilM